MQGLSPGTVQEKKERSMVKLTDTTEMQRWNAKMDALEANWLEKLASTRDEYKRDPVSLYETLVETWYDDTTSR